ncbi:hypothetical protein Thermo_00109 [Thermoplasmatales archaeon]|nr:hypothetical protein Thermo_00109 [Thermoplasmatales archaeon]
MIPRSRIMQLKGSMVSIQYRTASGTRTHRGILVSIGMKRLAVELDSGSVYKVPVMEVQSIKEAQL